MLKHGIKTPKYSDVRFQWLLNLFTLHIPELLWYPLIILSWSPLTKETDRSQIVFVSHTHLDNHITCPSHLHLLVFPEILLLTLPSTFLKKLNKKAKLYQHKPTICYVLVLNYSKLLSKEKSFSISRKEPVNTSQSRGKEWHTRDWEKTVKPLQIPCLHLTVHHPHFISTYFT